MLLALGSTACATLNRAGLGPAYFDAPPFHTGRAVGADTTSVAHLPVSFQRGANDPVTWEPDPAKDMGIAQLLAEIDAELDELAASRRVPASAIPEKGAPNVVFGCEREGLGDGCVSQDRGLFGGGVRRRFQLRADRASPAWTAAAREAVGDARTPLLVITLEIGEYPVREGGLRTPPTIDLGTRHREELPRTLKTDEPVTVLQLTGVLLAPDGTVLRAGAEGIEAKRVNVVLGALGVQGLFSDDDFRRIRQLRRQDLDGQPLAWKVALRQLVEGLLQQSVRG
ncbi:MAG TPA: hypothetical protein VGD77_05585 [Gemmatimonadaceae bacterium]